MKLCILGGGLTGLSLAKSLTKKGLSIDIFLNKKKSDLDRSRTIGISNDNLMYFNKEILDIKKLFWDIKKIEILGNERIPKTTIKMLSNIDVNDSINENKINEILKDLYDSNFFEDISINYNNNILSIFVKELPIIESITIEGVKAKKIKEAIKKELSLISKVNNAKLDKIAMIRKNEAYINLIARLIFSLKISGI